MLLLDILEIRLGILRPIIINRPVLALGCSVMVLILDGTLRILINILRLVI